MQKCLLTKVKFNNQFWLSFGKIASHLWVLSILLGNSILKVFILITHWHGSILDILG